jgi:hypothetical protein
MTGAGLLGDVLAALPASAAGHDQGSASCHLAYTL